MGVKVREKQKGSGVWWLFIDHRGRRKAKKIGKDKKVALDVAKKIEAKLVLGDMGVVEKKQPAAPTFEEYANMWITLTVPATCKPSTESDYKGILKNHVLPVFGKLSVSDINRLMIKKFLLRKIKAELAPSTVSNIKSCLAGTFNVALDDDVILGNPAHRLGKLFSQKNIHNEVNPLTKSELAKLLSVFQESFSRHYPLALTLALTGMRFGEALALKWDDVNFQERVINVERTFSRGKIGPPKNGKARYVDMSNQLTILLKDFKFQRKIETIKHGWGKVPRWVFVSYAGTPIDINGWRKRVFYKALEKAGLRKVRVHDLRHTYATLLIQANESLPYIRDQLGHHSIKITVDIYGHLAPGGNKDAVDRLDDILESATIRNLSATKNEKGLQHKAINP